MNFQHESINGEVAIGANKELYLLSQRHETLKYWTGAKRANTTVIEEFSECLKRRKLISEKLNVSKYMHMIVPDKHVVYQRSLPFPLKYSLGQDFALQLSNEIASYPLSDFQAALPMQVYRKTDSHWAGHGNALAASLVARGMGFSSAAVEAGLQENRSCIKIVNTTYSCVVNPQVGITCSSSSV